MAVINIARKGQCQKALVLLIFVRQSRCKLGHSAAHTPTSVSKQSVKYFTTTGKPEFNVN